MSWILNNLKDPIILIIVLSSLITTLLAYLQTSITSLQQVLSALIIIVLVLYSHFIAPKARLEQVNPILAKILKLTILFASSIFVQILILSTGALYSPFIILIYFFALGLSFQISAKASITFLLLSTLALMVNIILSPIQQQFIAQDPAAFLLYLVAFIGTAHLCQFLSTSYHIKSELYKVLAWQMRVDESIIKYLQECVFITNTNLQVVYANKQALQTVNLSEDKIYGKNLFNILNLTNINKEKIDDSSLDIEKINNPQSVKLIRNLYLHPPRQEQPMRVILQVLPIPNQENKINQMAFIIANEN